MKTLRNLGASAALAIAATAGVNAYADAPVVNTVEQVALQTQSQLAEALHKIRVDAISGQPAAGLVARIDTLVEQIDALAAANPESAEKLAELRRKALLVRAELGGTATDLVNQNCVDCGVPAPVEPMAGTIISDTVVGEQVIGSEVVGGGGGFTSGGGGGFAGGGGGGGGMLGGGGIGGFAALGLGAAGLAVGIANGDDDNNAPGVPASPSTP